MRVGHLELELIAEAESIQPGESFWAALRLKPDAQWHVYWRNPGDSGLPPALSWQLPPGFVVDSIQWPYPERIEVPPLTSLGYRDETLLPIRITPPRLLSAGTTVELKAHADWLVCKVECIPGEADLELILPVHDSTPVLDPAWTDLFKTARERLPISGRNLPVSFSVTESEVILDFQAPGELERSLESIRFFPYEKAIIKYNTPQTLTRLDDNYYRLTMSRSSYLLEQPEQISGILVSPQGWGEALPRPALEIRAEAASSQIASVAATDGITPLKALLFAFLGGLILNLMPCVLPVLSLKVLGFVSRAGEGRGKAVGHGLIFSLGVVLSFWLLAGLMIALRAGGEELGWGFQLQSTNFVLFLSAFMFLFGLNLLGVFEIGGGLSSAGGKLAARGGWLGSFLNGVTATVVATPCTAPFMGSALGFSLSQPAWVSFLIFTALGLGMSTPYLLLAASPRLLSLVPKPGRWMESLKHFMGFLLMATVVWLCWVLGVQAGINAVAVLLLTLLVLGVAAWIYGRWGRLESRRRRLATSIAALVAVVSLLLGVVGVRNFAQPHTGDMTAENNGLIRWEPYSEAKLTSLRESGTPVFLDFTAAWCLSCQVNERVAFGSSEVQQKFVELGINALKADWTSRDESITRALAGYGRNSVPLYVLYGPGAGEEPIILPEILTPGIVLDALSRIESQRDLRAHQLR